MHKFDEMTEPELRQLLSDIATAIRGALPPDTGFVLLATPFGRNGIAQYISNVQRADAASWMHETVERWRRNDCVER